MRWNRLDLELGQWLHSELQSWSKHVGWPHARATTHEYWQLDEQTQILHSEMSSHFQSVYHQIALILLVVDLRLGCSSMVWMSRGESTRKYHTAQSISRTSNDPLFKPKSVVQHSTAKPISVSSYCCVSECQCGPQPVRISPDTRLTSAAHHRTQ